MRYRVRGKEKRLVPICIKATPAEAISPTPRIFMAVPFLVMALIMSHKAKHSVALPPIVFMTIQIGLPGLAICINEVLIKNIEEVMCTHIWRFPSKLGIWQYVWLKQSKRSV